MVAVAAGDRLFEPATQAVLVTAGDQAEARGRADRGIGVSLHQADTLPCQLVQVRGAVIRLAIHAEVAPAQVVGQDEQDVRLARMAWLFAGRSQRSGGRQRQRGKSADHGAAFAVDRAHILAMVVMGACIICSKPCAEERSVPHNLRSF